MKLTALDTQYMLRALRLAARGRGCTSPNPMVGAIVVSGKRVVGEGYHRKAGGPHAEVFALQAAGSRARGGTLYVTLEPCCHTNKRTPPCVPAIIAAGIRRVVVAMPDPNPSVRGQGVRRLKQAGLTVAIGCLHEKAERLNEWYAHRMKTGRPFVVLKAAITLDGKIATAAGESQWITGGAARRHGHHLRSQVDAIMVGVGTVLRDDPRLTVRLAGLHGKPVAQHPLRVILDSSLRVPLTSRVLSPQARTGTVLATTARAPKSRITRLRSRGVSVWVLPSKNGRVSLRACLARLAQMGINSLLIEGGSELAASALREGVVNRIQLYIAPRLLGGQDAKSLFGGTSPKRLADAIPVSQFSLRKIGEDLLIEGNLRS